MGKYRKLNKSNNFINKSLSAQGGPARGGKITSITIVLVVIGITGWFLVTKKSQDDTDLVQKNTETESEGWQKEVNIANKKWSKNARETREKFEKYIKEHGEKIELEKVDTIGWKTYTDNQRGFSFQYPGDWHVLFVDGLNSLEGIEKYYSSKMQRSEKRWMKRHAKNCDKPFSEASSIKGCVHPFLILCLTDKYKYRDIPQRFKEKNSIDGEYAREYCNIAFKEYYPVLKSSKKSSGEMLLESVLVSKSKGVEYMISDGDIYISLGTLKPWSIRFTILNGNYIGIRDASHGSLIFNTILQTLKYTN